MARILTDETTLHRWRTSLGKESRILRKLLFVEAGLALLLVATGVVLLLLGKGSVLLIVGALFGILTAGHWLKIRQNEDDYSFVEVGLKGEQEVTKLLKAALGNDSYILNDISVRHGWKQAQMDHVVVTPRGIFVIETKTWRGVIEGDEKGEKWTQTRRPGQKPHTMFNPILQNRRQIRILRMFLEDKGVDWPDIYPVLVSKSRYGEFRIRNSTVPILRPKDAAAHISAQTSDRVYTDEEVTAVISSLMRTL
ncbi:MAG: NERD domain-containing protein [Verrucomicrobia bacterium]|nr:NERD domain-containing protein [Verrucomicrobiota bacterium]MBU1909371.1 NERD domain-containing protein [Verrucomicrobiota bacterium]